VSAAAAATGDQVVHAETHAVHDSVLEHEVMIKRTNAVQDDQRAKQAGDGDMRLAQPDAVK